MRTTRDAIWNGAMRLWQPARGAGYRFNLDPILLAGFCGEARHVVDLGAGCGVIGLLLLGWGKAERVTAVELQSELASLARRNAEENGLRDRIDVLEGDLRTVQIAPPVDGVVLNPPYFTADSGRVSPDTGRELGRREHNGTLGDFVRAGAGMLRDGGRLWAIVPHARGDELLALARSSALVIRRARTVRPRPAQQPKHLLLEAVRGAAEEVAESDLIVHRPGRQRDFSDEVRAWVDGPVEG